MGKKEKQASSTVPPVESLKESDANIQEFLKSLPKDISLEEQVHHLARQNISLQKRIAEDASKLNALECQCVNLKAEFLELKQENLALTEKNERLENLCREVQKHSNVVKATCKQHILEERDRQKEKMEKVDETIQRVKIQLNEYQTQNSTLREQNVEMLQGLKKAQDEFKLREEHVKKLLQQKVIELKLAETKQQQAEYETQQAKLHITKLQASLAHEMESTKSRIENHVEIEKKLVEQIGIYRNRESEVDNQYVKCKEIVQNAKEEIEKRTARSIEAEKQAVMWLGKYEILDQKFMNLVVEHSQQKEELLNTVKKLNKMTELCRALQSKKAPELDLNAFLNTLSLNGGEPAATANTSKPEHCDESEGCRTPKAQSPGLSEMTTETWD